MSQERVRELESLLAEATMNMLECRRLDDDIFKLAEDHKRALAFIAAWELLLEGRCETEKLQHESRFNMVFFDSRYSAVLGILKDYHQLKTEHLEAENEDDEIL